MYAILLQKINISSIRRNVDRGRAKAIKDIKGIRQGLIQKHVKLSSKNLSPIRMFKRAKGV